MKTYAIQRKDYLGAVYTTVYVSAANQWSADQLARNVSVDARAVEADREQEQAAIGMLIDTVNRETHARMQRARP